MVVLDTSALIFWTLLWERNLVIARKFDMASPGVNTRKLSRPSRYAGSGLML